MKLSCLNGYIITGAINTIIAVMPFKIFCCKCHKPLQNQYMACTTTPSSETEAILIQEVLVINSKISVENIPTRKNFHKRHR